jgi:hypothetical protein
MRPQPDDTTCGPTCLHAVYRYFGDPIGFEQVLRETPRLAGGGTLAVLLALDALRRGYSARVYTYNLHLFDPTWFGPGAPDLRGRLAEQLRHARSPKKRAASEAYLEFLERGGEVRLEDLTPALLRRHLAERVPVLTGLNATWLYRSAREREEGERLVFDDVAGEPTGHFVVVHGYDKRSRRVLVADPLGPAPGARGQRYTVRLDHLACAIMLGIVTYDANLLVIQPRRR